MKNLLHPNIIRFLSEFRENGKVYIVMEYCEHGSLRDYIKSRGPLSDRRGLFFYAKIISKYIFAAAYVLGQLVSAVEQIHRQNMMHRDLSTSNVLIHAIHGQTLNVVRIVFIVFINYFCRNSPILV